MDRWLTAGELPSGTLRDEVAEVLDRMIVATQLRYPSVGDVARAVRFRYFEKPLVKQARQEVVAQAERLLAELTDSPGGAQDMERVQALVASPEPLIQLLARRIAAPPSGADPVLEVLTRRYYRRRSLENLQAGLLDGRTCVTGDYELSGKRLHLVALMAQHAELAAALSSLTSRVTETADPSDVVVDLYLSWPDRPSDADELAELLRSELMASEVLRSVRRVTVTICTPSGDVETLTFRPSPDGAGLVEEDVIRGMHPLTAQRLDLWRLKNFNGKRLPSAEDTYLIHAVAKENPNDERLIAMAEVRDATPLTNAAGEVVGFPTVERLLTACIDSLRRARASLGRARRLDHNRIFLYAWPSIELPPAQLATLARAIAPLTVGAGVDQIVILGRLQVEPGAEPRDVALRFSNQPGTGVGLRVTDRPTEPMRPLDDYTQKVLRSRARGLAYPYELAPLVAGRGGTLRRARPGRRRPAGAGGPPAGQQQGGHRRRSGDDADAALPRGHDPGGAVRRPDEGARHGRRTRVRAAGRRAGPGRGARPAGGVVRAVLRRQDLDGQRHREHGRRREGAAPDHRVHPGRWRDQRRRGGHQRGRAAVLERRSDDAHAHQGHPGDDAGQRDGADRQALAGLLGRGVGGGQLRPRRLRPGDGPERAGAVLGAEPVGGRGAAVPALRPRLPRAG